MKKILTLNTIVAAAFMTAPHFPVIRDALGLADPTDAVAWMISVGSFLYLCLSSALLWKAADEGEKLESLRSEISLLVSGPRITPMRDDQFYPTFLEQIEDARARVLISYFGDRSPDHSKHPGREEYYSELLKVVRRRPRVVFRRLLRDTPQNRQWATDRLGAWVGLHNFSVALLQDSDPEQDMPLSMSVQVVDDSHAWLVAVEGHERTGTYRDLLIQDVAATSFFEKYHNRLWARARVLVDSGHETSFAETLKGDTGE